MPTQQPATAPPARRGGGAVLVISVIALVLSIVAVGLAAWTALRPAPTAAAADYTAAQRAEAKTRTCTAVGVVRQGITMNTNLPNPGGDADVTGAIAVQANARLALTNGGRYLLDRTGPATPTDLADAVTTLAGTLIDIGTAATAGQLNTDAEQAARLRDADTQNGLVTELCK